MKLTYEQMIEIIRNEVDSKDVDDTVEKLRALKKLKDMGFVMGDLSLESLARQEFAFGHFVYPNKCDRSEVYNILKLLLGPDDKRSEK